MNFTFVCGARAVVVVFDPFEAPRPYKLAKQHQLLLMVSGRLIRQTSRLPPLRELSGLIAQACTGLTGATDLSWEEICIQLAAKAIQFSEGTSSGASSPPPAAVARVSRAVRMIEQHPDDGLSLGSLASEAGLSPYHFLRTFGHLTGVTPHQYILRARLREAAMRLVEEPARVLDIALDCGFGDVSNFNHAFREEFGVSPRAYRLQARDRARHVQGQRA